MRGLGQGRTVSPSMRTALNLVVIGVAAWLMAGGVAPLLAPRTPLSGETSGDGAALSDMRFGVRPLADFAAIVERNVFRAARSGGKTGQPSESLASASLDAVLLGTMQSGVPALSRAVILEGNRQRLVRVGDAVGGSAVVEILRRAVVLERNGERRLLPMEKKDDSPVVPEKVSPPPAPKIAPRPVPDRAGIVLTPVRENGQAGLWVSELRQGSRFSKAGLMVDDIILKLDGKPVAGADLRDVTVRLARSGAKISVLRDGEVIRAGKTP